MKKILIVDDQPYIRTLLEVTLENQNYQIFTASDGSEALRIAAAERPDLILLDIVMPGGVDGYEVCRLLKSDPATAQARIILLTAQSDEANRDSGRKAGADDYIVKPFSPLNLIKKVAEYLD